MALTRRFLTDLGIEKEQIQGILDEHGNTIELVKEKAKEDLDGKVSALNGDIDGLKAQLANAPKADPDGKDWKTEYDTLKSKYDTDIAAKDAEFSTYKTGIENEKAIGEKRSALRKQLEADGANPKLTALLEKEFDLTKIDIKDGKISGWEEMSKGVKESYADVFGEVKTEGVITKTPPAGGASSYTLDDIKKMSPQEINENWDNIKNVIAKG